MKSTVSVLMITLILISTLITAFEIQGAAIVSTTITRGQAGAGLVVGTTDSVRTTLDPANAYDYFGWDIIRALGAGLVDFRPGGTGAIEDIVPDLATNWSVSSDNLHWTFTLRQGVRYDDGTEFNATHVKFTFDREIGMADPNGPFAGIGFADLIEGVVVVNTYTVRFDLKFPFTPFLSLIAGQMCVMVDPKYAPMHGTSWNYLTDVVHYIEGNARASNPMGLGPYTLSNWTRVAGKDFLMVLVANPNYWNASAGIPKTESITIEFYTSPSALALAITSGEVDVASRQLTFADIDTMKNNANLHVWEGTGAFIQYLCLQERYAPFNQTDIRKAVAAAINRTMLVNTVFQGHAQKLYSMIPNGMFGHTDAFLNLGDPNYTRTRELLAPFGYNETNKLMFTLYYEASGHYPQSPQQAIVLKASIEASGVMTVNLQGLTWPSMGMARNSGTMEAFVYGWWPDYIDPDDYVWPFLQASSGTWLNLNYSNPTMDRLIEWARGNTSSSVRNSLYNQIQDLTVVDSPIIPLYQNLTYVVSRKEITGIFLDITQEFRYQFISGPPPIPNAPDIAVVNVSPWSTTVYPGYPVFISTTVENRGNQSEMVHLNLYTNATQIGTQNLTVLPYSNRTVTTMWNTIGFSGQYRISAYAEPLLGETNILDNRLIDGYVNVVGNGFFIIVAGNRYDNDLLSTINYGCNQVYKILRSVGYSADEIYYLNQPECGYQDLDGDGKNDIDAWASNANLQWAIENWAANRTSTIQPLYLYLFDHGGLDTFAIDNTPETLYSWQLANWLDNLETATGAPIHVIYAACQSGSFVDELSKTGRVIVTSSREDESSYSISGTWEAFSTPFWNQIKSGHSIGASFNYACSPLSLAGWWDRFLFWLYGRHQTPQLDDNGDGISHAGPIPNAGDGYLANNIYIGACEWPYPWINQTMPSLVRYWPPASNTTLWAKVENETELLHVTAYMVRPDWIPPNSTDTLVSPETEGFEMTDPDNDGNWTVEIPAINFTCYFPETDPNANFTFFITAEQDNGDMATPSLLNIQFSKTLDPPVDEMAPWVSIERPLENRIVSNVITVNGTAVDDLCLKKIEVYVDNTLCGTINLPNASSSFYEFNLDTTLYQNGNRTIQVEVFDAADNCFNQTLNVIFENFVHEIAVTDVVLGKNIVGQGYSANFSSTVANHGSYAENVNLTVYANQTLIAAQAFFLPVGNYTSLVFTWNTTTFGKGNYTVTVHLEPLKDESNSEDNNMASLVALTIPGDVNGDFIVDIFDAILLAGHFGEKQPWSHQITDANVDVNGNGVIDIYDAIILAGHFSQHYP